MNLRLPKIKEYPAVLDDYQLDKWFEKEIKTSKGKGYLYERYIGYLLETQNYEVDYRGINCRSKKGGDGGIDLIVSDDECTWIIQCKNYKQDKKVRVNEIRDFHDAIGDYATNYSDENVFGAFFVTSDFTKDSKIKAENDKIKFFKVKLPARFPVIKCEKKNRSYFLPTDDAVYDFHKLNITDGDCYCLTIEEAFSKGFTNHRAYPQELS